MPIVNADILVLLDKEHQEAVRAKEEEISVIDVLTAGNERLEKGTEQEAGRGFFKIFPKSRKIPC